MGNKKIANAHVAAGRAFTRGGVTFEPWVSKAHASGSTSGRLSRQPHGLHNQLINQVIKRS